MMFLGGGLFLLMVMIICDFEDGVQNLCAIENKHKIIVTGNVKDFKESKISVMTPKEILSRIKSNY